MKGVGRNEEGKEREIGRKGWVVLRERVECSERRGRRDGGRRREGGEERERGERETSRERDKKEGVITE
jgi:hypothetical protein